MEVPVPETPMISAPLLADSASTTRTCNLTSTRTIHVSSQIFSPSYKQQNIHIHRQRERAPRLQGDPYGSAERQPEIENQEGLEPPPPMASLEDKPPENDDVSMIAAPPSSPSLCANWTTFFTSCEEWGRFFLEQVSDGWGGNPPLRLPQSECQVFRTIARNMPSEEPSASNLQMRVQSHPRRRS